MRAARRGLLTAVAVLLLGALLPPALAAPGSDLTGDSAALTGALTDEGQVGHWQVSPGTTTGTFALTWRSPRTLPVTDARPEFFAGAQTLGSPRLSADGRTLRLTLASPEAPDTDALSVVLSGRVLDEPAPRDGLRATAPRAVRIAARALSNPGVAAPSAARTLAADPGTRGPHKRLVTAEYRMRGIEVRGLPKRVEMLGRVVAPASPVAGSPLVLFLHGRHEPCFRPKNPTDRKAAPWCPRGALPVPSYRGYDYAQRLLASQGYFTVSVSANGINAQDFVALDGGAAARSRLVRAHLAQWARWSVPGSRFPEVDMSRVVLVGHSRGGEGVNQASIETPLGAPYRIAGQVLLAPTNFGRRAAAYVPTVTVLPYCDGDVVDLQGQSFTDLARDVTRDDTALRSSVLVMGANHNFFNTEWTPRISTAPSFDDARFLPGGLCDRGAATRLTAVEQRAAGRSYVAGAVALLAERDETVLPMFDGSNVDVASAGAADVRTHAVGGGRDVRRMGSDVSVPAKQRTTTLCRGLSGSGRPTACGREQFPIRTPHWVPDQPLVRHFPSARAVEMRWRQRGQTGSLELRRPLDLNDATALDLRTAVDPTLGGVRLRVRVYDGNGQRSELTGPNGRFVPALPGRNPFVFGKIWAQTLRVPVGNARGQADLGNIRRIELVGQTPDGRVWLLDLAAARDTLAAVPVRRLPRVTLGALKVDEGDGTRARVVRIPFRVRGVVREPARLRVLSFAFLPGFVDRGIPPQTVELAAGQRTGAIRLRYRPDRVDDVPVQHVLLVGLAVRGLQTSGYFGRLRVLDDDPSPRITFRRVSSSVAEGGAARWRLSLERAVDYPLFVLGRVARGSTRLERVSGADVPRPWLRRHAFPLPRPRQPLHEVETFLFEGVRPGRRHATLTVPLLRDGVDEGREAVSLRLLAPRRVTHDARTVTVVDPR